MELVRNKKIIRVDESLRKKRCVTKDDTDDKNTHTHTHTHTHAVNEGSFPWMIGRNGRSGRRRDATARRDRRSASLRLLLGPAGRRRRNLVRFHLWVARPPTYHHHHHHHHHHHPSPIVLSRCQWLSWRWVSTGQSRIAFVLVRIDEVGGSGPGFGPRVRTASRYNNMATSSRFFKWLFRFSCRWIVLSLFLQTVRADNLGKFHYFFSP